MYPFTTTNYFIRNAWYVAAFSHEVTRKPLQRTIMDEPIVLYRTEENEPKAMWGLCAHRNYPLAEGTLVGDELQCPYHGYRYSVDGLCTRIPGQNNCPKNFRQRTYPCVERAGFVWLWMGLADEVDPSLMPPLENFGGDQKGWKNLANELTAIPARWPLMIDNLMDLSHIGFLHLQSIDAPGAGDVAPDAVDSTGFKVTRFLPGSDPSMLYVAYSFPHRTDPIDVELGTEYVSPGFTTAYIKFYEPGTNRQELLGTSYHYQGITPESRTTTLGFSSLVRDVEIESTSFDDWLLASVRKTRKEDKEALEHLEIYADRYADARRELSGINDVGAIKVRRHLSQLLETEGLPAAEKSKA
ncbi:Dicamba O-demethylase, oxygenase component [Paraburkholderia sediminicola]|uniref:Dicamba O-demethylase, oxygenase component n=1 Tax=Paraburkholderia sediminicola TaxID=458836 RepID=A0A6J5CUH5_9BURK|nr:aromatic ring-hydroxylating dioxygenase subunit alpha [Paraburkholderia sediminicola]CAB3745541.1 Dicamba O-demethylase, oxygenase component [Paraburkholderia sediminicola]